MSLAFSTDDRVKLTGLVRRTDLNDAVAVIVKATEGEERPYTVRLDGAAQEKVRCRAANLTLIDNSVITLSDTEPEPMDDDDDEDEEVIGAGRKRRASRQVIADSESDEEEEEAEMEEEEEIAEAQEEPALEQEEATPFRPPGAVLHRQVIDLSDDGCSEMEEAQEEPVQEQEEATPFRPPGAILHRQVIDVSDDGCSQHPLDCTCDACNDNTDCGTYAFLGCGNVRKQRMKERERRMSGPTPARWDIFRTDLERASRPDFVGLLGAALPVAVTEAQQRHLDAMEADEGPGGSSLAADQELQKLLWRLGCEWSLMPHQPASVRFCAGVPADWPASPCPHASPPEEATRGCILADDMGLGKTFSSIGGILVREYVAKLRAADLGRVSTLVVVPNPSVLDQWLDSLRLSGIHGHQVLEFKGDFTVAGLQKPTLRGKKLPRVVLMRKHKLQSEQVGVFDSISQGRLVASGLTPHASLPCEQKLRDAYEADKGRRCKGRKFGTTDPAQLCKLVHGELKRLSTEQRPWLTIVIDEAHELRNPFSFWAMGAMMAGVHSHRVVLLSGTPYNNNKGDLATMCSFIDPSLSASRRKFWEKALESKQNGGQLAEHNEWLLRYLLRREKSVLKDSLPPKTVHELLVHLSDGERENYSPLHEQLKKVLKEWLSAQKRKPKSRAARQRKQRDLKRLSERFLGQSQECRMALVHPGLSGKGRELTRLFAPSRSGAVDPAVLKAAKRSCVCCNPSFGALQSAKDEEDETEDGKDADEMEDEDEDEDETLGGFIVGDDEDEDDDEDEETEAARVMQADDDEDESSGANGEGEESEVDEANVGDAGPSNASRPRPWLEPAEGCSCGKCIVGPPAQNLVQLPSEACGATDGVQHMVHACCYDACMPPKDCSEEEAKLYRPGGALYPTCPRCRLLRRRLHLGAGSKAADAVEADEEEAEVLCAPCEPGAEDDAEGSAEGRAEGGGVLIATDVVDGNGVSLGGLRLSTKLLEISRLLRATPPGDKTLVLSYFKGGLDVVEAMLVHEGVGYRRFDGDDSADKRRDSLKAFKADDAARVLLMSIVTGGVGLNIAEANRVIFLDVWWNPFVHLQCEDRTYRIGQTKPVEVTYLVAGGGSLDEHVMHLGSSKRGDAAALLGGKATGPLQSQRMESLAKGLLGRGAGGKPVGGRAGAQASGGPAGSVPASSRAAGKAPAPRDGGGVNPPPPKRVRPASDDHPAPDCDDEGDEETDMEDSDKEDSDKKDSDKEVIDLT